ncbi:MAG TPA: hypothetical protein ENG61_03775 [Candidatus Korarchaeota archaeon]|nr:MAG: hypothetical protein DRO05_01615 [Candidatus Korarchaeota archaeon]HDD69459.1 hypothetical protein [Candidatus Korarchaeota archaeon]
MKITRIASIRGSGTSTCVVGVVIHSAENFLVVEDGSGKAKVYLGNSKTFNPSSVILVVGNVLSGEGELKEIQANAIADLSGIDLRLLRRTIELEEELEKLEVKLKRGMKDAS